MVILSWQSDLAMLHNRIVHLWNSLLLLVPLLSDDINHVGDGSYHILAL